MRHKSISKKDPAEKVVRDIRRKTRRKHSTEEKIRIVLEGLRGEGGQEPMECWLMEEFDTLNEDTISGIKAMWKRKKVLDVAN
ncbi:MAG: hypothetical protein QGF09_06185 [Rhodospirillales bacterium]|nr:hypothetical protein [Rhodospirillales bacterium]